MYDLILSFITAFLLTVVVIPSIIRISYIKGLYDAPDERRVHKRVVPSLGGVGIFSGLIFSVLFWTPFSSFTNLQYILCALVVIFLIGVKDDIIPLSPDKKMLGQIAAACILVFKADIRLTSLHGLFGIHEIPDIVSYVITIFTILVINNAFNLIDGINGLAGSITVVISITFGTWFYLIGSTELATLSFALCGAVVAFLKYNYSPARIFMGDTGSLILGLISSILAIKFIEVNGSLEAPYSSLKLYAAPAVAMGILIIPLFDTLRVFTLRFLKGKSPFHPDKTHIHHMLLDLEFTHMQATGMLVLINLVFIASVFTIDQMISDSFLVMIVLLGSAMLLSGTLRLVVYVKKKITY